MNPTATFQDRVIDFLHTRFPDSLQMAADELQESVAFLLQKAASYGFKTEADQVAYVITAYLLGLHFDTEMPAATEVLTDPNRTGTEKANWLQQWTQQMFEALEEGQAQPEALNQPDTSSEADMAQYLGMQANAAPYNALAEKVIAQLMHGDSSALRMHFSLNFLQRIGEHTFNEVCANLLVPFFRSATALANSSTVTYTTDSFGNTGFAFYRTIREGVHEKPFIIYMVNENDRIVVANLVINKTYADMH